MYLFLWNVFNRCFYNVDTLYKQDKILSLNLLEVDVYWSRKLVKDSNVSGSSMSEVRDKKADDIGMDIDVNTSKVIIK